MKSKGIMDAYRDCSSYNNISIFGMADVHQPNHQRLAKSRVHIENMYVKDDRFSNPSSAKESKSDSHFNAVYYRPAHGRPNQIA